MAAIKSFRSNHFNTFVLTFLIWSVTICLLVSPQNTIQHINWDDVVDEVKEPYMSGKFASARSHAEHPANASERIANIAIFLLGSMKDAFEQNLKRTSFFGRLVAARYTWARHVNHFYMVTGEGNNENKILSNDKYCRNVTLTVHHHMGSRFLGNDMRNETSSLNSYEVYECRPNSAFLGITVLHFPQCTSDGWGPPGPCCRCQHSMRFFLLARRAALQRRNQQHSRDQHQLSQHFPEWMVFADDDYYMRGKLLESLLSGPETPPKLPFSLVPWSIQDLPMHRFKQQYGGSLHSEKCKVPCIHRFHWMGWGGFSYGALERMEEALDNDKLVSVCKDFAPGGVTHDVGLGVFNWIQGETRSIPIELDGSFQLDTLDGAKLGVIWHSSSRREEMYRFDALFDVIWRVAANASFEKQGMKIMNGVNQPFSMETYIASEVDLGVKYYRTHPIYPVTGFKNTVWYRKKHLQLMIDLQIGNETRKEMHIAELKPYSMLNCEEDALQFDLFLNNTYDKGRKSITYLDNARGHEREKLELEICLNFTLYMNNLRINDLKTSLTS